jgi:hypothetical protein
MSDLSEVLLREVCLVYEWGCPICDNRCLALLSPDRAARGPWWALCLHPNNS